MTSNPSNARESVALRNELQTTLPAPTVTSVNWRAVVDAAAPALARGWTGFELARWAIADLAGTPADNPGAVIVTTLRDLGTIDPPRVDGTSQPPPSTEVIAAMHHRHQPSTDPAKGAQAVRDQMRKPA